MTALNPFYQAILDTNTIGAIEDDWTGAIYIPVNEEKFYCSPNWEHLKNEICFQYIDENGDHMHWSRYVMFTGDIEQDVQLWQEIVKYELSKITTQGE